jgi:hypothetical protein
MKEQKKKRIKNLSSILIFLLTGTLVYSLVCYAFYPKSKADYGGSYFSERGFLGEKEKTLEIMAVGNSALRFGLNPLVLYETSGFTSYNNGLDAQTIEDSYSLFLEAEKKQDLKLLIIETDFFFADPNLYVLNYKGNQLSYFFSTPFVNKLKWPDLKWGDLFSTIKDNPFEDKLKGYFLVKYAVASGGTVGYSNDSTINEAEILDERLNSLTKLITEAKSNNIQIMLFSVPTTSSSIAKHNTVARIAKENNILYLDMNNYINEIGFNKATDYFDQNASHCNNSGSTKLTKYLSEFINSNYKLNDLRSNETINNSWSSSVEYYHKLLS